MASPVSASTSLPAAAAGVLAVRATERDARLGRSGVRARPGPAADEALLPREQGDLRPGELPFELDQRLVARCRERGPLRAVLARIAARLVSERAWERLGFARLSDYAAECLGVAARSVRDLAAVGSRLKGRPDLEDALVSGALGWTKVRLLARLPPNEDDRPWIDHARCVTAEELSRMVRAVDRGSVEGGGVDPTGARSGRFAVRCSPEVRWKWHAARWAARRAAGRMLHPAEAAELVAAEVLSALPLDGRPDAGPREDAALSRTQATAPAFDESPPVSPGPRLPAPRSGGFARDTRLASAGPRPSLPRSLAPLLEGLEEADSFSLDERLRHALSLERRLEARIGPVLAAAWSGRVHRALQYETRDAYVRERLGMDPSRARALVRVERVAAESTAFARAYRSGELSWVRAKVMAPLVSADPRGRWVGDWLGWARRVTVRRLREDVEDALTLAETDPALFHRSGGLPPEAHREIGAQRMGAEETPSPRGVVGETCWASFVGPPDVVQLFTAVVCTVRRHIGRETGKLPTEGEALGVMLDHCLDTWCPPDEKTPSRHRVFARDGWRCAVPGCTSMDNLHDHHIRFRSAGGSDEPENRITVCAFHHLRGVHRGILRCVGRAPDGVRWELGIRPGVTPRLVYRSGDIRIRSGV